MQLRACFEPVVDMVGTFSVRHGAEKISGWLEETDQAVAKRIPYDESRAEAALVIEPGYARYVEPAPGYTAFEQLIVALRCALRAENVQHLWLCQVNFLRPLSEAQPLAARLRQTTLHRFYALEIMQQDSLLGTARVVGEDTSA